MAGSCSARISNSKNQCVKIITLFSRDYFVPIYCSMTGKRKQFEIILSLDVMLYIFISINTVMNLFIYNPIDGELMLNYNKGVSGSLGSSSEDLINVLMRKASRRIIYSKDA